MKTDSSQGVRWLARTLVALDHLLPRPANLGLAVKPDLVMLAQQGEAQAPTILQLFDPAPDPAGKTMLDLGCGLGGKTAYYAAHGAKWVVGLEIDSSRARAAHRFIQQRGLSQTAFMVVGDAARLPFRHEVFDLVMATDTWEHLSAPNQALIACHRVSTAGGATCICFMPYYSPWGAHIWDWVAIPWLHVWLPERWLQAIVCEVDRMHHVNARRAEPIRIDWQDDCDPAHARRLTVARFVKSLRKLDASVEQLTVLPIGFRTWRPIVRLMARLTALPGIRELLTGLVVCVLRKDSHHTGGDDVHRSS